MEEELPPFVEPDAAADAVVPAHGSALRGVRVGEEAGESAGAHLGEDFDGLHPEDGLEGGEVRVGEDLVFVVPAAEVGLHYGGVTDFLVVGGPSVGSGVHELDLVGVVGDDLAQGAPVVAV